MIDINLDEGQPLINDEVSLILQQIDMLFETPYKEVHGAPGFGTHYDDFLFDMTLSNAAIEYQIKSDLKTLDLFGFEPDVEVAILEGTLNDIILCKISLTRKNEYYEKTYKIQ